jgi:hypothetical protein
LVVACKNPETALEKGGPRGSVGRATERRATGAETPGRMEIRVAGRTAGVLMARGWNSAGDAAMVAALRGAP